MNDQHIYSTHNSLINLDEPLIPKSHRSSFSLSSDYKYLEDLDGEFAASQGRSRATSKGKGVHFFTDPDNLVTLEYSFSEETATKNRLRKAKHKRKKRTWPLRLFNRARRPTGLVLLEIPNKPLSLLSDFVDYQKQRYNIEPPPMSDSSSEESFLTSSTAPRNTSLAKKMTSCLKSTKRAISKTYSEKILKGKTLGEFCRDSVVGVWRRLKKPFKPDHNLRIAWDVALITLVLIDMVMLPLQLAFSVPENYLAIQMGYDIAFMLDIVLSFHTAYYDYGNLVTDHRRIAKNYAKSWLVPDIIAAFPFFIFERSEYQDQNNNQVSILRIFRVLKILRAVKFFKLNRIFFKLKVLFSSSPRVNGFFQFVKLFTIVVVLAHWLACAWYLVALLEVQLTGDDSTWLSLKGIEDAPISTQYAYSLYWAVTTMLTVGYGDIVPATTTEVVFNIVAMLFGCAVFAYSLNGVSQIVQGFSQEGDKLSSNIYAVDRFLKTNPLSKELQGRIRGYMDHLIEGEAKKKRYREQFLNLMTDTLKKDILVELHGDVLVQNLVFRSNFSPKFLNEVSNKLQEKTYCQGDPVYLEDSMDTSFYIIVKGKMHMFVHGEDFPVKVLQAGEYFGEISFFSGKKRTVTVKSSNYSQVFYLDQAIFLATLEHHDEEKEKYREIWDKIHLYNDYSSIFIRCAACNQPTHPLRNCSQLQYRPNSRAIGRSLEQDEKMFLKSFTRRECLRFHAKSMQPEISQAAEQFRDDFEQGAMLRRYSRLNFAKSQGLRSTETMFKSQKVSAFRLPDDVPLVRISSIPRRPSVTRRPSISHKPGTVKTSTGGKPETGQGSGFSEKKSSVTFKDGLGKTSIISKANKLEEFCKENEIDLPEGGMAHILNSILVNPKDHEVVFDQVRSFKCYFTHNNIENVVRRLNSLNKVSYFNEIREEKAEQYTIGAVFETTNIIRRMSSPFPEHKSLAMMLQCPPPNVEKQFTYEEQLVIRRTRSGEA